ncbi:ribosome recycling factor [Trametes coccinea BRFM310]|uniref:Ribosome recycling factor n=1 Tax=Trametes coccinea (strain BRFM310) TaxID=1353009 RepID=A0A1Y2J7G1_TRAC3|nr:ribosome recycling factor [Trametes coccinea BRFM310]
MAATATLARLRLAAPTSLSLSHAQCSRFAARRTAAVASQQVRFYAKAAKKSKDKDKGKEDKGKEVPAAAKGSKGVSTDSLIPASQRIVSSEEYKKTEGKMQTVLEWFRKEVAGLETRATGRVTPALLSPVRVKVPGASDSRGVRLEEVATVGVKEGTTLIVTVFEEHTLKSVEQAIYEAKIPGATPQRLDNRTIKVPIPKPTVETRNALYTNATRLAEDARVQMRKHHQALLKKEDITKRSPEFATYQGLLDKLLADLDKILAHLKKTTG